MGQGDLVPADHLFQVLRVPVALRPRDDDPRACQQRPENLPYRDVEADRGLLQHRVPRCQAEHALRPQDPVEQRGPGVHRPLGTAGRTRGEDDVGEVAGTCQLPRRGGRPGRYRLPVAVEQHRDSGLGGDRPEPVRAGDQHWRPGVGQHPGQALSRVGGVERQVRTTRQQHRESRDQLVRRAVEGHGDDRVRPHSRRPQMMGEPAPALGELTVGDPRIRAHDGRRLRRPRGLAKDQGPKLGAGAAAGLRGPQAERPHFGPDLGDPLEASTLRAGRAGRSPARRHRTQLRPNRILSVIADDNPPPRRFRRGCPSPQLDPVGSADTRPLCNRTPGQFIHGQPPGKNRWS